MPPQPEGIWNATYSGDRWRNAEDHDRYRRGLYTFWRRTSPYPSFATFDAPSRELVCARRNRSNTPLQALTLLNDPAYFEAAEALAARMRAEGGATDLERLAHGFRLCTSRQPNQVNGPTGAGCANSGLAGGASLAGFGNSQLSADSFGLHISGVPDTRPGILLVGAVQVNGGLGNLVGDGLMCTGTQKQRSHVRMTTTGNATFTDFNGSPFGAASYGAGVPTNYQFWYRDQSNTCSGMGFNFTNAWTVTWTP